MSLLELALLEGVTDTSWVQFLENYGTPAQKYLGGNFLVTAVEQRRNRVP